MQLRLLVVLDERVLGGRVERRVVQGSVELLGRDELDGAVDGVGDGGRDLRLDALVLGGRTPMVFVIGEDSTVAPIPIELEAAIDGQAVVTGPLQPGMQVVTEGNERIRPGMTVRILED